MLPQDVSLNLSFIDENNSTIRGQLKMLHNNGNVSLSFYHEIQETKKISQIPDNVYQLSDFTMIETDSTDNLVLTLSGSRSRCQLYFMSDSDISIFQRYISTKVRLKNSVCNPCVYLLEPLDSTILSIAPFSSTILPKPNQQDKPHRISLQDLQYPGLAFESDSKIETLSADEFSKLFDSDGKVIDLNDFANKLYNKEVDKTVMGKLWQLILFPDFLKKTQIERDEIILSKREIYKKVKLQWELTTFKQWKNFPFLRSIVESLETDLKAHSSLFDHFPHKHNVQTIAFNILLSLSFWNSDEASYVKGMVTYLSPFLDSFIFDAPNENQVTFHHNNNNAENSTVSSEEVEADIFWCFTQFYDSNGLCDLVRPSNQPQLKPLFIAVGGILELSFPELLQLLYQKHAYSLDFLLEDCSKWYTTCFSSGEILRLWISILAFSINVSNFQFNQYFIVSLLFALAPSFVEMNPLNTEEFVRRFHVLKKSRLDLNLLLTNANKLMEIIQQRGKIANSNSNSS